MSEKSSNRRKSAKELSLRPSLPPAKFTQEKEVKISSDVSGEVVELYVKEGDSVKIGQLLARINPDIYKSAVERGVAGLNTAKSQKALTKLKSMPPKPALNKLKHNWKMPENLSIDQNSFSRKGSSLKLIWTTPPWPLNRLRPSNLLNPTFVLPKKAHLLPNMGSKAPKLRSKS